jgi:hypothetical protein
MESESWTADKVAARLMVFDLVLLTFTRAVSIANPSTARAIARGLQDHRARLVLDSPRALEAHAVLLEYIQAIDQLLAQKPQ